MEINLEKFSLKKLLLPLFLLIAAGSAFALRDAWMPLASSLFENVPTASEVAEQGVAAFYTIDHEKGIDEWVERYCELSTDQGCKAFTTVYAPAYWPTIEQNKIATGCKTNAVAVVDEYIEGNKAPSEVQVWLVDAQLTNPFDDATEDRMEVYAMLKRLEGEKTWVFERVLFENETMKYQNQEQDG
jgi:hypothetical protein